MIIVEGPDGGGKSTLIKKLATDFRIPLAEHSKLSAAERNDSKYRSRDGVRKRVYGALLMEVTARFEPELHDRLFFSPMIYDHIFKRPPSFVYAEEIAIGRMLNALKIPCIFCLPDWKEINKQYLSVGQMEGVPDKAYDIYKQYVQMVGFMEHAKDRKTYVNRHGRGKRMPKNDYSLPPAILYDWTNYDEVAEEVSKFLAQRKKRQETWST